MEESVQHPARAGTPGAARTVEDVMGDFLLGVMAAAQHAQRELAEAGSARRGTGVMSLAVACGLEPKGWYGMGEVARLSGIPRSTVYQAAYDGRLRTTMPACASRGRRASAADIEEWLDGMEEDS